LAYNCFDHQEPNDGGVGDAVAGWANDAGVQATAGGGLAAIGEGAIGGVPDDGWTTTDDGATTNDPDDKWTTDDDWSDIDDDGEPSEDEEEALMMHVLRCRCQRKRIATAVLMLGMYHCDKYMDKAAYRIPVESGYD
jgi:hypothetical protein